jgi:ribonuclease BN (tRNA processing enzyme)
MMKLTVLGGAGAWPPAGSACSGYLVEHAGFRLLLDPGYATAPRLFELMPAEAIDAVLVSHGHPDHVADLNPLLRARALRDDPAPALAVYALPGALRAVLALDRPGMLDDAIDLHEFSAGDAFPVGPFQVRTRLLPHFLPNAGTRLSADGSSLTYTGDAGPTDDLIELAEATDLLLAEASHVELVPDDVSGLLNTALEVGRQGQRAGAARLVLTHLFPGTNPDASLMAARRSFQGPIDVASGGLVVDLGSDRRDSR